MAHFEIKDLSFYYPTEKKKPALSHINLKIERGQYVTVCGRSGSGKTTLLKHLKTVLAPHGKKEGEIFFEGKPLKDSDLRTQSSRIGYVMQNPDNQIVTDKVWHELAFGLESLGMDQKTIRLRVAEMAMMEARFRSCFWPPESSVTFLWNQPAGPYRGNGFPEHSPQDQPGAADHHHHYRAQAGRHFLCLR